MYTFKHISFLVLLLYQSASVFAQDNTIRLIVRGDDMGFCHAANEACIASYQNGMMRTVEVMPTTPWFAEAIKMLEETPGLDVGVHLTLTSEWENLKWRPLTPCPSLTDEAGYFYPMIWSNNNYGKDKALQAQGWKLKEIEQELRAQIELALLKIPRVSHLTAHMGWTNMNEEVMTLFKNLAQEYDLAIHPEELGVKRISYKGPHATFEEKVKSFTAMLESLTPGTYYFLDHPAYDTPEVQAVSHIGYENVAVDRQGVTDMFTSPEVQKVIEQKGIQLISYADLVKK